MTEQVGKQFCIHGHDTWITGRNSQKKCKKCESATRDLLCFKCNSGLGQFHDSIEMLEEAAAYLKRHGKRNDL